MIRIKPLLTEKTIADAKEGVYTFLVDLNVTKHKAKILINETFGVVVKNVRSIKMKGETKKLYTGRIKIIKPKKKVMVTLDKDQKIDLFDTGKK